MRRWLIALALLLPALGAGCWLTVSTLAPVASGEPVGNRFEEPTRDRPDFRLTCFGYVDGEDGVRSLVPRQPGRVVAVKAHEGDLVSAGAVILQLDDAPARHALAKAEAAEQAAREELAQAAESETRHGARLKQQEAMADAAAHRLAAAQEMLGLKQELSRRGQGPAAEAAAAQEQVRELEAAERVERSRLEDLKAHDPRGDERLAEAKLKAAEATVLEAKDAVDECALKAPEAGTVLRILAGVGDVIGGTSKEPVVQFVSAGPRVVRAEVAHEYAGRVHEGQRVRLVDEFDPTQSWTGRVVRLSDWYTRRRSVVFEPGQVNDVRTLECVVRPDSEATGLRLGQRLRVAWSGAEQ